MEVWATTTWNDWSTATWGEWGYFVFYLSPSAEGKKAVSYKTRLKMHIV